MNIKNLYGPFSMRPSIPFVSYAAVLRRIYIDFHSTKGISRIH